VTLFCVVYTIGVVGVIDLIGQVQKSRGVMPENAAKDSLRG
jgi:hypothetical protein